MRKEGRNGMEWNDVVWSAMHNRNSIGIVVAIYTGYYILNTIIQYILMK
jgi:hypothetical protein